MNLERSKRTRTISSSDDDDGADVDVENASKRANVDSARTSESFRALDSINSSKEKSFLRSEFPSRVLEKTLRECGLVPDFSKDTSKFHVLESDQAVFQKKITNAVRYFQNPDHKGIFVEELIELLDSRDESLQKALGPTKTSPACQTARSSCTLFHNFALNILFFWILGPEKFRVFFSFGNIN